MRNTLTMLLIGLGLITLAALYPQQAWLLFWSGGAFCLVSVAYALQRPQVLGKRLDGTMAWGPCLCLLPYLLPTWLLWYCQTHFSREASWNEIAPGLWLGRRVSAAELPPGVTLIADLTSEFPEPRSLRTDFRYVCLPTLDNAVPDRDRFAEFVEQIAEGNEAVYLHCALGHGRSALVMAAVLMERGLAKNAEDALALVQLKRSGVRLNRDQKEFLADWQH